MSISSICLIQPSGFPSAISSFIDQLLLKTRIISKCCKKWGVQLACRKLLAWPLKFCHGILADNVPKEQKYLSISALELFYFWESRKQMLHLNEDYNRSSIWSCCFFFFLENKTMQNRTENKWRLPEDFLVLYEVGKRFLLSDRHCDGLTKKVGYLFGTKEVTFLLLRFSLSCGSSACILLIFPLWPSSPMLWLI